MDMGLSHPWKNSLISLGGGGPEFLVQDGTEGAEADPTWTPNGESIVFGKSDKTGSVAIYQLDLKTRNVSSIPGSEGIMSPRVSPDGRYISALTSGQAKLMLFDMHTNHWSSLMDGEWISFNEWSHDSKYIYVRQIRAGGGEVVRVRIKDHTVENVLSFKNFPQLGDDAATWIGLTPDDAPLLMRDRSVQEIYALDLRFR